MIGFHCIPGNCKAVFPAHFFRIVVVVVVVVIVDVVFVFVVVLVVDIVVKAI